MKLTEKTNFIRTQAEIYGIKAADMALAIVEVEVGASIKALTTDGFPYILPEPHIFHRRLNRWMDRNGVKDDLQDRIEMSAIQSGLASEKWNRKFYNRIRTQASRRAFVETQVEFCRGAGVSQDLPRQSMSMGIGQIMGFHYRYLGFESADDMHSDAKRGFENQLKQMLMFISKDSKLLDAVNRRDVQEVSRRYNGPAYKKNKYDDKLSKALTKWSGRDYNSAKRTDPKKESFGCKFRRLFRS